MLLNDFFRIVRQETTDDGSLVVTVCLNAEHAVFRAHFPERPVTPGACQIQMVTEILARCLDADVCLMDIGHVKFLAVVEPDASRPLTFCFRKLERDGQTCRAAVDIRCGGQTCTRMSVSCRCRPRVH